MRAVHSDDSKLSGANGNTELPIGRCQVKRAAHFVGVKLGSFRRLFAAEFSIPGNALARREVLQLVVLSHVCKLVIDTVSYRQGALQWQSLESFLLGLDAHAAL